MGKVFDEEMIWGYPYLAGEEMHKVPVEKCLLMAPKLQCEKAPWQRANHLGKKIIYEKLVLINMIEVVR